MGTAEEVLAPGAQIGDYLVEEVRAEGGFAFVYRTTHLSSGRPAAVKLLHRLFATSPKTLRRFQREVELVDRLHHRNIVQCYGFGEHIDGRPFLAMEWLEGRTLSEEVRTRGCFRPEDAVRAICDLCQPLAVTHDIGVVHRDLKGSNVIAVPDGDWYRLTVVDFGVAKLLDPDVGSVATTVGVRVGSPHAMAPEQILGAPVDARTDVYALGILLYQLLTARLPFEADSDDDLEEMQLSLAPTPPGRLVPVPSALDDVVVRCLAKDPALRPGDVLSLSRALQKAL